jgi:hypothetical protein
MTKCWNHFVIRENVMHIHQSQFLVHTSIPLVNDPSLYPICSRMLCLHVHEYMYMYIIYILLYI